MGWGSFSVCMGIEIFNEKEMFESKLAHHLLSLNAILGIFTS